MRISILGSSLVIAALGVSAFAGCQVVSGLSGLETQADAGTIDTGLPDTFVDLCANNKCGATGNCAAVGGKPVCTCGAGFRLSPAGDACLARPANACDPQNPVCDANATCPDLGDSSVCKCRKEFGGDGKSCACPQFGAAAKCGLTFASFGAIAPFKVPAGVIKLEVHLWGGGGGGDGTDGDNRGGAGGYVSAELQVVSGSTLGVSVGAGGSEELMNERSVFGGGSAGKRRSGGGGGASQIGLVDGTPLVVVGGGGGAGSGYSSSNTGTALVPLFPKNGSGGSGGGDEGTTPLFNGNPRCLEYAGKGGTKGAGGAAGGLGAEAGEAGLPNRGGAGGIESLVNLSPGRNGYQGGGGGGGGGYRGGGGGGWFCGGGGGSGFVDPALVTNHRFEVSTGSDAPGINLFYEANVAQGRFRTAEGGGYTSNPSLVRAGGDGRVVILW